MQISLVPPLCSLGLAALLAVGPAAGSVSATDASRTWTFEADKEGAARAGFTFDRTGSGKTGRWVVLSVPDAPSGKHVLAQIDADSTDYRFPVAVAAAPALADLRLTVRCKPISGQVDQACGVVFRYRDAGNYYLARANTLEENIIFYSVKGSRRREIKGVHGKVLSGVWHELSVTAQGDRFTVSFDGKQVVDAQDSTFPGPGRVGVWTKADSVTEFDDLTVAPLLRRRP